MNDAYDRFKVFGVPPAKQGDYAYLLHIVRSLKTTGKGACILPHGVLFRGNAEADIRRALVRKGYIKGIIGLPANLFYGTCIPACIVVVDKDNAQARKGLFAGLIWPKAGCASIAYAATEAGGFVPLPGLRPAPCLACFNNFPQVAN